MDEKTFLLSILEKALRETIREWLRAPTEYLYEKDIQAALYRNLRQLLEDAKRWSYYHRVYDNDSWKEQKPMALVGCEHKMKEGYSDIVLWDPNSQTKDYKCRRALAVVELKATFPDHGQYRKNVWDFGLEDYDKVRRLVQNGNTDWGIALVFCALPSESEARKFDPIETPAFEGDLWFKVARFRIMSYGQVPNFRLI